MSLPNCRGSLELARNGRTAVITSYNQVAGRALERITALSDGVFAIAPRIPGLSRI